MTDDRAAGSRLPGRRRARRPGPDDRALAGADRRRRRDLPRPADPRRGPRRRPRGRRAALRRQGARRALGPAGGDRRAADRGGAGRARASSGSRAATRSSSAAAARRPRRCAPPGSSSRSCPGVTAGVAAPAYAGIPVTHRDDASAVAFVTGHEDPDKDETALDWEALAALPRHARLLHGRQAARARSPAALIAAGRDPDEPAAAIERGTLAGPAHRRRRRCGTLAEAVERRGDRRAGADRRRRRSPPAARRSPGSSAARCTAGASSSPAPAPRRAGSPRRCATLGAEVVELPAIRIEPRIDARRGARRGRAAIRSYALVCLTSPNGVRLLFEAMAARGPRRPRPGQRHRRGDRPGHRRGRWPSTAIIADIVPERFVAEALVEALADVEVEGKPVLIARAAEARDVLPDALRERGAEVDVVALYETVREEPDAGGDRGRAGGRLRHLHLVLDRPQPDRGARRALPDAARGSSRSARSPARPRARPASRSTSRPTATTSTASSPRCSPTLPSPMPAVRYFYFV